MFKTCMKSSLTHKSDIQKIIFHIIEYPSDLGLQIVRGSTVFSALLNSDIWLF